MRHFSLADKVCIKLDSVLKSFAHLNQASGREEPGSNLPEPNLSKQERRISSGLMRVNHTGEVCAQALYFGQGLTANLANVRQQMIQAAQEEVDHLNWCKHRLQALGSHTSYLNPVWFVGSFMIGASAGIIGDQWSLGFVAETEQQVVDHLERHRHRLPEKDRKSYEVVKQMQIDEALHRQEALKGGGKELLYTVKAAMRLSSKVMTTVAYWI